MAFLGNCWRRVRAWWAPPPPHPSGELLLEAAERGDAPAVQVMVAYGTPPDEVRTRSGETALWLAANGGHRGVVEALLAVGADPAAEDSAGTGPITRAAALGRADIIELMARARPEAFLSPSAALGLHEAAENGHSAALRALLRGGTPPRARARGFLAAIFPASVSSSACACVAELLAAGADPNEKDASGRTPLHWAARAGEMACIRLLLACGGDPALTDKRGRIAMDDAPTDMVRRVLMPLEEERPQAAWGPAVSGDAEAVSIAVADAETRRTARRRCTVA